MLILYYVCVYMFIHTYVHMYINSYCIWLLHCIVVTYIRMCLYLCTLREGRVHTPCTMMDRCLVCSLPSYNFSQSPCTMSRPTMTSGKAWTRYCPGSRTASWENPLSSLIRSFTPSQGSVYMCACNYNHTYISTYVCHLYYVLFVCMHDCMYVCRYMHVMCTYAVFSRRLC